MPRIFCLIISVLLMLSSWQTLAASFNEVINRGELRVGLSLEAPWAYKASNGALLGSEVDIARRLAKDMKVSVSFKTYPFNELITALRADQVDIIISGMAITPERALAVNFSKPYADAGIGLVANKKLTDSIRLFTDMNSSKVSIGVPANSVAEEVAKRVFSVAKVKPYPTQEQAVQALLDDELHAYVDANPVPKFLALDFSKQLDLPLAKPLLSMPQGMAVAKGDADWLAFLDAWITARAADGWLASTHQYWFESLRWRAQ